MENSDNSSGTTAQHGFVYFCGERLRYFGGLSAWLFFGPFLLGIFLFESVLSSRLSPIGNWISLLAYVLIFPPVWRAILVRCGWWRKGSA